MSITIEPTPAEVERAFKEGCIAFGAPTAKSDEGVPAGLAARGQARIRQTLPVYTMSLEDASAGQMPKKPSGWQLVSDEDPEHPFAAEVRKLHGAEKAKMTDLVRDPDLDEILEAARAIKTRPEVDPHKQCEQRVLRIPALLLEAYWLHSSTEDLIAPYNTAIPELEAKPVFKISEFLGIVQAKAPEFKA